MYNSYEEYMQSVLGMNVPNTYMQNNNYYEPVPRENNMQEVNRYYPEIYGVVYPLVQKVCSRRNVSIINEKQINEMVDEVYNVIEPGDDILQGKDNGSTPRNGDVKNPRAKDNVRETRRKDNFLLRDLIKILIIRELLQGNSEKYMPRPPMMGEYPNMQGMQGMQGAYNRVPIMRPGYMGL